MSKPAVQQAPRSIDSMLMQAQSSIKAALPSVVKSERFIRVALTEIRKSKQLQQCDPVSVCAAVMQAAQLGLEFGSSLGQIYLVPFGQECTLMVGYRGYVALLQRSGAIKSMTAHCVFEGDFFEYELGLDQKLVHRPTGKQTNLVAVYAVATLNDGTKQFEVMSREAVEYIRDTFSRGKNSDAWRKSFDEMAKKTVVRRLIKMLPITPEVADALEAESFEVVEEHQPEKIQQIADGQMQLTVNESKSANNELFELLATCEQMKIDCNDLPENMSDQQIIAAVQILKERIRTHVAQHRPENT